MQNQKINVYVVQQSSNINVELVKLTSYLQKQDQFRVFAVDNLATVQFNQNANNLFLHDRFVPLITEKEFVSLIYEMLDNSDSDMKWDVALLGKCTNDEIKPNRLSQYVEFDNFYYPLLFRKNFQPVFDVKEFKDYLNEARVHMICLNTDIFSVMTNNNLNNVNNENVNNNEPVNKLIVNNKNNNNNQNQNTNFWYWVGGIVVLSGLIFYYSKNYRKSTNTKTDNKDEK
jgi:hypothetical protein